MGRSFDMEPGPATSGGGPSGSALNSSSIPMSDPDGYGRAESDCGDAIEIFVALDAGVVVEAGYRIEGCAFTVVCGRAAATLIRGKTLAEARRASASEQIEAALGGLPAANRHCAKLASDAVAEALVDAAANMREPWKRHYRRLY
jgi:NifU-like protein involved in Fe-S cluster formation